MQKETKLGIARGVAKYLIKTFGEEIENLTYSEVLADEIGGVDQELFEEIEQLTRNLVEVAEVEVYFQEWRLKDDGTVMSKGEADEKMKAEW